MPFHIIEDPWELVLSYNALLPDTETTIDGGGSARAVASLNDRLHLKGCRGTLPSASFPYEQDGKELQSYYLPTYSKVCDRERDDFAIQLVINEKKYSILQCGAVGRFQNDESPTGISKQVTNWINWLIHSFQNLTHLDDKQAVEDSFNSLTRREWTSVVKQFLQSGAEEALMSLIVKLASDRKLKGVLQSISDNPRKILNRIRENLPLNRIQQLDAACIRDYARRPGLDAAEKAGPRQRLLALNRIEDTNTLENQVTAWVMEELGIKSRTYISESKGHENSPRVRDVRRLVYNAANWRECELFQPVRSGGLNHPIMPNYPLQLDRRYHCVYEAYQELLQDRKVHDDAWAWQRSLWACLAKTILYARLTDLYSERFSSFLTIRNECDRGNWLESPVAPGPFTIKNELCYVIDSADVPCGKKWIKNELFKGARYIGRSGCDAIIYFPKSLKVILVWYYYWTGSDDAFFEKQSVCNDSVVQVERTIFEKTKSKISLNGFIIGSGMHGRYESSIKCFKDKMASILLPSGSSESIGRFDIAIKMVLED